jgi:hypothetical protein
LLAQVQRHDSDIELDTLPKIARQLQKGFRLWDSFLRRGGATADGFLATPHAPQVGESLAKDRRRSSRHGAMRVDRRHVPGTSNIYIDPHYFLLAARFYQWSKVAQQSGDWRMKLQLALEDPTSSWGAMALAVVIFAAILGQV